jgi:hypothetical protein
VLAISSGLQTFIVLAAATVIATLIIGFGRAAVAYVKLRQTKAREDEFDQRTLSEFFFDTERDPRTGTPAKEGWTTKVDRALTDLAAGQRRIEQAVHLTLSEVQPDGNGGHNFRGVAEKAFKASSDERDRIHDNETDTKP